MTSRNDPVQRIAAGMKTALIVCVIGFIALVANRSLVSPGGVAAADEPARPAVVAPDVRAVPPAPVDGNAIGAPTPSSDLAEQYEGGDNHPPTF
jgi:hypothetical protein